MHWVVRFPQQVLPALKGTGMHRRSVILTARFFWNKHTQRLKQLTASGQSQSLWLYTSSANMPFWLSYDLEDSTRMALYLMGYPSQQYLVLRIDFPKHYILGIGGHLVVWHMTSLLTWAFWKSWHSSRHNLHGVVINNDCSMLLVWCDLQAHSSSCKLILIFWKECGRSLPVWVIPAVLPPLKESSLCRHVVPSLCHSAQVECRNEHLRLALPSRQNNIWPDLHDTQLLQAPQSPSITRSELTIEFLLQYRFYRSPVATVEFIQCSRSPLFFSIVLWLMPCFLLQLSILY